MQFKTVYGRIENFQLRVAGYGRKYPILKYDGHYQENSANGLFLVKFHDNGYVTIVNWIPYYL